MAAAASRDLERSCDEAAVAGRDAAFRAAYGAAMLDAVEEGIEARAPLTTHFRGGKAAMKERLLSIASGGTRKKGNLWPHMTIYENLAFGLKLRKVPKAEIDADIKKMLALVSMSGCEKKYPNQMSGGQQQRIAIARSLLLKPSLLLLDEPFSALDAKIRQQMREELKKIQSDLGITVVFVTHDQEEAMSLSHRIVVMNKGKFEQIGTPTEIYDKPATRHVASFIGEMNFIDKDNKTIAVRPEDVTVSIDGTGDFTGTVRTIMVLGHYVVVNVQRGENVIKCFVDRDISEKLSVGQTVGMHIGKHTVFDK